MSQAKEESLTSLYYLKRSDRWHQEKPYFITVPPSALPRGHETTNEESEPTDGIKVMHLTSKELSLSSLDIRGFTVASQDFSPFPLESFQDYASIRSEYVPPMEAWIRKCLNADIVVTLSVNVRKRDVSFPQFTWGTSGDTQPIQGVHVGKRSLQAHDRSVLIMERLYSKTRCRKDTTGDWTREISVDRTPADADFKVQTPTVHKGLNYKLTKTQSIWRPLFGPVRDWPLAMLDFQSVDVDRDLIAADVIYPHYVGESFNVFHNPKHRWYFVPDQMPHEVLIFKSFDSLQGVSMGKMKRATPSLTVLTYATACPHASFDLDVSDQRRRESVDMITAVVYPD
ncbi:MAG: hypothetical protein Q9190_001013 [Brigantiaea leucoxantha]